MMIPHLLAANVLGQFPQPREPHAHRDLGPVGTCPTHPTLVICIGDDSGSITAPGGADPISDRYREMEAALRAVAGTCGCTHELAAVLHFDTPAGDTGPLPLSGGVADLMSGLAVPEGGYGTSDLLPAMQRAAEMASSHADHRTVLVIFSDFQLTDRDPGAVTAALTDFPGTVYGCVLGAPVTDVPGVDHLVHVDHTSAPGSVAKALLAGLSHHRDTSRPGAPLPRRVFHNALTAVTRLRRTPRPAIGRGVRAARRAARHPDRSDHGKPRTGAA